MTEWIEWAKRLQALAQNGLAFASNDYDVARYRAVERVAAEILARGSDTPLERVLGVFGSQTGEATPKVDVRAVIPYGRRILMVRQDSDGLWSLPGGWADPGESPSEAAEREAREETGVATRASRLIGVYDRSKRGNTPPYPFHVYKLFMVCDPLEPLSPDATLRGDHEISEVGLFGYDDLPPLSLSRVAHSEIADTFAHLDDPALPATFD